MTYSTGRDTTEVPPPPAPAPGRSPVGQRLQGLVGQRQHATTHGIAAGFDEQKGGTGAAPANFLRWRDAENSFSCESARAHALDFDRRITANANLKFDSQDRCWLARSRSPAVAGSYKSNIWFLDAAYKLNSRISFDGGLYRIIT